MSFLPRAAGKESLGEQIAKKGKSNRFLDVFKHRTKNQDESSDISPQPERDPLPEISPAKEQVSEGDDPTFAEMSLRLWETAYEDLKASNLSLVNEYETILTRYKFGPSSQNVLGACDGEERLKLMTLITEKSLQKAQSKPKVESAAGSTIELIDFARETVGALLGLYPPAALAWSGFCTLTPILLKPITEKQKMHEGLEYVLRRMKFSMHLAPLLLRDNWKDNKEFLSAQNDLSTRIHLYYQNMLQYEMSCVKACYSRLNGLRNLVNWDGWENQVEAIKDVEVELHGYMKQYNTEAIKEYLRMSTTHLDSIKGDLSEMRQSQERNALRTMTREQDLLVARFGVTQNTNKNASVLNRRRAQGTCEWFLRDDRYHEWLHSDSIGVLLVSAPPGCGKSFLSALLVEDELPVQWPDEQTCHYFFDGQQEQRKAITALRTILHQLLLGYPAIVAQIERDVNQAGGRLMEFNKLGEIFKKATLTGLPGQVICVLDALDECDPSDLDLLIEWIFSHSTTGSVPAVKFVATTRGFPRILKRFEQFAGRYLHVSTEEKELNEVLQAEIEIVMKARFDEFAKAVSLDFESPKYTSLWRSMQEAGRGQRTYLWVKLVFEALDQTDFNTMKEWEAIIKSPPLSIFGAYDTLFKFVKQKDEARIKVLLHLIYAASTTRPLTIGEANMAMTAHITEKTSVNSLLDLDDEMMMDKHFQQWIIQACGFFISVYDGRLFFIHQTANEYLSGRKGEFSSTPGVQRVVTEPAEVVHSFGGSVSEKGAHAIAAECCIACLSVNELSSKTFIEKCNSRVFLIDEAYSKYQFLAYATSNWLFHFRFAQKFHGKGSESTVTDIDDKFAGRYFSLWESEPTSGKLKPALMSSLWPSTIYQEPHWTYEPLSASVAAGQAKLIERHLSATKNRSSILSKKYPASLADEDLLLYPLSAIAIYGGHINIAQLLLDRGADVNGMGYFNPNLNQSLLHLAVRAQEPEITKMLLDNGAKVDVEDYSYGGTPFALALDFNDGSAKYLLDAGASWERAIKYLWRVKTGYGEFQSTMIGLWKSEYKNNPGFLDAAHKVGYDFSDEKEEEKEKDDDYRHRRPRPYRYEPRRYIVVQNERY